ncbi:hypothetical protein F441_13811 [Phytophthora nicotianae CJ01A1]|uniref:RxLR effector protein n=6 Tax=Phytophthora nicotianae TaxID=4792 RepID=W2PXI5_PHYN3|nr:hypothetical protein PPTG_14088 [Phytophthora nicotianae INRA-310]ETI40817.1 hypothetical protein F443_13881 [Phytophthora nicotianae P1569]ETK90875.1 hypothetical protein L915_05439 [Phytophthora nicotianae]ETO69518.1 hypothetical protein F444_13913 [Phytophthora nicotianae P1976]ETP10586.1 hypothetical protein F441_13811 [Phytophthora nicotianae CJ01A1]KUG01164.1 hypothetical protein AM587_10002232 [Phytophthora nicotianae]
MRFSYFLSLALATLLSSCNANAAISGNNHAKQPSMISSDTAVLSRPIDASNVKRFLRTYRGDHEDKEDKEERRNPALLDEEELVRWTTKWAARADDWFEQGYTPAQMRDKLTGLDGVMNQKNGRKFYLFVKKWRSEHPNDPGI